MRRRPHDCGALHGTGRNEEHGDVFTVGLIVRKPLSESFKNRADSLDGGAENRTNPRRHELDFHPRKFLSCKDVPVFLGLTDSLPA